MPSEEETLEEQQVQGLSRKHHYAQYVQAAAELGEGMPLGEDSAKEQMAKAIEYLRGGSSPEGGSLEDDRGRVAPVAHGPSGQPCL